MSHLTQPNINPFAFRINDAVRYSGLSRSTLYSLESRGELRMIKAAGRRLILRSDLEAFLASNRRWAAGLSSGAVSNEP
ncbi:helix-turn-helix domain-containing protein [Alsobacter sp. KACC 23698]|uniref:helix-turn-helix domain-containing protein n=1 Tax=Alsobacter sp. KACC 23698 TaxID=3149229 RepID=UPI003877E90E